MPQSPEEPEDLPDDPAAAEPARMSFGEHLEELRSRVMKALFGAAVPIFACVICYQYILDIVARPYKLVAIAHGLPPIFQGNKPQEAFLTTITLAFQAGLVIASPWIIFQIWQFVAAGLYPRERKIVYRYTAPSAILFLLGVSFFYFIVLPMTLSFFMSFAAHTAGPIPKPSALEDRLIGFSAPSKSTTTAPATAASRPAAPISLPLLTEEPLAPAGDAVLLYMDANDGRIKARTKDHTFSLLVSETSSLFSTTWRYDDYLTFVTFTALVFGLAFELPMVIMILAQIGLVRVKTFRSIRKYAYFGIVAIAAIAAPSGDLMTLAFLSVPLFALYELGILAAAFVTRHKPVEPAEDEADT